MKPTGFVLYRGPSLFDGAPLVVIATVRSKNAKTSNMVQTWIMREDIDPYTALLEGRDATVCGDCVYRAGNGCYVQVPRAPLAIWRAYHRGRYQDISGDLAAIEAVGASRTVRLGAYGDPVACPEEIWQALTARSAAHTGYTHAWRVAPRVFRTLVMASCDTPRDRDAAQLRGYRTFRVNVDGTRQRGEMTCPASAEAGHKTSCADCHACDGARGEGLSTRDVTIRLHGFTSRRAVAAVTRKMEAEARA